MSVTAVAIASTLSLLSALLVAILSHFFSITRKRHAGLVEMRLKAYTDFINAASRLVAARRTGRVSDELEELVALNDAKIRICICAAPFLRPLERRVSLLAITEMNYRDRRGYLYKFLRLCHCRGLP